MRPPRVLRSAALVRLMMTAALSGGIVSSAGAQAAGATDLVLRRILDEGMQRSRLEPLAHSLLDSIGPRLTGTPGLARAH